MFHSIPYIPASNRFFRFEFWSRECFHLVSRLLFHSFGYSTTSIYVINWLLDRSKTVIRVDMFKNSLDETAQTAFIVSAIVEKDCWSGKSNTTSSDKESVFCCDPGAYQHYLLCLMLENTWFFKSISSSFCFAVMKFIDLVQV